MERTRGAGASVIETLAWVGGIDGCCRLLDQTLLPAEVRTLEIRSVAAMVDSIRRLAVRGAPAIGVAAAFGLVLALREDGVQDPAAALARLRHAALDLAAARPTAVNLAWALERMLHSAERAHAAGQDLPACVLAEARAIAREDAEHCRRMGELGAELLRDGMRVLTHCNAGALATAGIGTALAPLYVAHERGWKISVYADETRPLLQGARLTAWELARAGIDVTLITDGMAGSLMSRRGLDAVLVGADRIARNGDVANKIGTYGVAVLAARHGVPFYVVAPLSTFDPRLASGAEIPIEERAEHEVTEPQGRRSAPQGVRAWNPAFDVTPAELVTAIVTEAGRVDRPDENKVLELLRRGAHPALAGAGTKPWR
jgi:methylthioribose-1-phosphate isomerase